MAKGKTPYTVSFQADPNMVNETVQSWLSANGFRLVSEEGIWVYCSGNGAITTKRYFEYTIFGNQLNILAYLQSVKKPFALDSGLVGALNTTPYVSLIGELVSSIENLSVQGVQPQYYQQSVPDRQPYNQQQPMSGQQPYNQQQTMYNQQPSYGQPQTASVGAAFQASADKRLSNFAIVALALGILNVLLSLIGMSFGVIVIIAAYMMAVQGMKSSKKNLAIAGIIATSISLIIIILELAGVMAAPVS